MGEYFCGWYFKCQSPRQALAIIPAFHKSKGESSCSIQLITKEGAFNVSFPYENLCKSKSGFGLNIGENQFSADGIKLSLTSPDCRAEGELRLGELSPIKYDIMGPFRYVPFMECRHSVVSMSHTVTGNIRINGIDYSFDNDLGYIEGDRGYSFPKEYAWTQCFFENISLMLSVASIPIGIFHFNGVIAVVMIGKTEYRLATYLGARIKKIKDGEIIIAQGDMTLCVRLVKKQGLPLFAPKSGAMSRTIHESVSCTATYRFEKGGQALFSFETKDASFEYEYKE